MASYAQSLAEGIRKFQRVEKSSRGYTKAQEGRRDKRTFRGLSADQDDHGPICFDRLIPPFHQGFFFNWPNLGHIVPINQSFDLPDGRTEWPPIARLF